MYLKLRDAHYSTPNSMIQWMGLIVANENWRKLWTNWSRPNHRMIIAAFDLLYCTNWLHNRSMLITSRKTHTHKNSVEKFNIEIVPMIKNRQRHQWKLAVFTFGLFAKYLLISQLIFLKTFSVSISIFLPFRISHIRCDMHIANVDAGGVQCSVLIFRIIVIIYYQFRSPPFFSFCSRYVSFLGENKRANTDHYNHWLSFIIIFINWRNGLFE